MTPDETALVLAKAALIDMRTIGEPDVLAWHEILHRIPFTDALESVVRHYGETRERIMPADVLRLSAAIDHERRGKERRALLDAAAKREAIAAGPANPPDPERVKALVREVVANLPIVDSDRIAERARLRAQRERGRPIPPPRREKKRLTGKETWPKPATDDIAALATRYLLDGYTPTDVSQRLCVSKRWCEKTVRRFKDDDE